MLGHHGAMSSQAFSMAPTMNFSSWASYNVSKECGGLRWAQRMRRNCRINLVEKVHSEKFSAYIIKCLE
jgi:hypothetical protein